ncbi:MAG: hypothetical protein KBT85_12200, partial [Pseudomonas sp.]|nr:hypothetical protein [Pseudomonas sp.]
GNSKQHLIPTYQPAVEGYTSARKKQSTPAKGPRQGALLTQHTGLPPRDNGSSGQGGARRPGAGKPAAASTDISHPSIGKPSAGRPVAGKKNTRKKASRPSTRLSSR